jgi:hypothetical protein
LISTENLSNFGGRLRTEVERAYLGFEATIRVLGRKKRSLVRMWYLRRMTFLRVDLEVLVAFLSCYFLDAIISGCNIFNIYLLTHRDAYYWHSGMETIVWIVTFWFVGTFLHLRIHTSYKRQLK